MEDNDALSSSTSNEGQMSTNEKCIFDEIIGHIENLLIESEFQALQRRFLEKYWQYFEPGENKLICTEVHNEYIDAVEGHIEDYLLNQMPNFTVSAFYDLLHVKQIAENHLSGEVMEVLQTLTDFVSFKEMFLDFRAVKEGKVADLSSGISITSLKPFNAEHLPR